MPSDTYIQLIKVTTDLISKFPEDKIQMMIGYLLQCVPIVDTQLKRIEDEFERNKSLSGPDLIESMSLIFIDVRFFYELLYWIGNSIEKTATANLIRDGDSPFGAFYKSNLVKDVDALKKNRILLNHIHFDELIKHEVNAKKSFKKHLPGDKLLFSMSLEKNVTGIKIANEVLIPRDDIQLVDVLLDKLAPHWQEVRPESAL